MWFVYKEVIPTKANLAKCRWEGSKWCCFYHQDETIKHLFLKCPLAKLLWCKVHAVFNITPPNSITTLFEMWLDGLEPQITTHIRVRVCALLWAMWNCRNDVIFNIQSITILLQVIYRATAWIPMWSLVTHGSQRAYGDWFQPLGDDSRANLQPVWMVISY